MEARARLLEIEPRHGWAWLGLGWAHLELGSGLEARWCLAKAVELERLVSPHPTAGVSGYLGECLRRLSDLDGARLSRFFELRMTRVI